MMLNVRSYRLKLFGCLLLLLHLKLFSLGQVFKKQDSIKSELILQQKQKLKFTLIPNLEVISIRANDKEPFTQTLLKNTELQRLNVVQDIPYILSQTPSLVSFSDAGTGIGYTGLRIRGTDATRINFTINGIPYNDAESQALYFVDIPDIISSTSSIQIQRGVGSSTNGSASFGASINLSTNEFDSNLNFQFKNTFGSFQTIKSTFIFNSGTLIPNLKFHIRFNKTNSAGYIDRAFADLYGASFGAEYQIKTRSKLHFNFILGNQNSYQAYYGVPQDSLATNRTFNIAGTDKVGQPYPNQTDNYGQRLYQLFFNHQIHSNLFFNISLFTTTGKGYYEEYLGLNSYIDPSYYKINTYIIVHSLVRQKWLDNIFYGQIFSIKYNTTKSNFIFGGGWNTYIGDHFNRVIAINDSFFTPAKNYIDVTASKKDYNGFIKWQYLMRPGLYSYVDAQIRFIEYNLNGFENYPTLFLYPKYQFFNPKFGITYNKNKWRIYGSVAVANKEPNRTDFETGNTNLPLPEQLIDIECGAHFDNKNNFNVNLNLFFMEYQNQLVLTGKINDIGAYTRTNVPTSFRRGIEVESNYKFLKYFNMSGNLTWSLNKILNYTNYIDYADGSGKQFEQYFSTTDIGFSPSLIQNFMLKFQKKQWGIQYSEQYVGKQYLDNTSSNSKSINAYMVHNLRVDYNYESKKKFKLICSLLVNNLFNEVYEPNGYTYSTYSNGDITNYNYFYPMAGTNYNVVLNIVF